MKTHIFDTLKGLIPPLFCILAAALVIIQINPGRPLPPGKVLTRLLTAQDDDFFHPAGRLERIRKVLEAEKAITLITDQPFGEVQKDTELHHWIQNYFAPMLVNPNPGEEKGIIFCANRETAAKRLEETGYQLLAEIAPGKGIIFKKP